MDFTTYEPRIAALEAGGGGGGDSDLSKAKVTLTTDKPSLQAQGLYLPVCIDFVDEEYPEDNYSALEVKTLYFDGSTNDIALYKGEFMIDNSSYSESAKFETTGNAEITWNSYMSAWVIKITGDCTIKIVNV